MTSCREGNRRWHALSAEPLTFDAEFLAHRFGLAPAFERFEHPRCITRHGFSCWVRSTQNLVNDRQRALQVRSCSRKVALILQQAAEIVKTESRIRVIGAKHLFTDRKRALVIRSRTRKVALQVQL